MFCLVAHPDDETIFCGGVLAKLAARGIKIHVLCLTRGEGGELGEPPLTNREHLGKVRAAEMACAVEKLGVQRLDFLGYVDPVVGPGEKLFAPEHDPLTLAGQITAYLKQSSDRVILTHGSNGEYGHPAHQLLNAVARQVVASSGLESVFLYSFAAAYATHPYPRLSNPDDPADIVIDISAFLDQKEAAVHCHATQNALFVRRRSQMAGQSLTLREVLLTEEAFHRHWPVLPASDDPFLKWL